MTFWESVKIWTVAWWGQVSNAVRTLYNSALVLDGLKAVAPWKEVWRSEFEWGLLVSIHPKSIWVIVVVSLGENLDNEPSV